MPSNGTVREYRCYNIDKRGRACRRKIALGVMTGENYVIVICPSCRQPVRVPGPLDVEHLAGVKS